jgi:hypothetical protein
MKQDSEIGVALAAGHPCYFIGFLPEPVPGQTIEDVCRAEAAFIEEVAERHPEAAGRPCLIGNCQAGWQIMMMAAIRPEIPGPIILAGSPLSYWAGVRGKYPMRYLGGVLGGTWMTALAGDLGGGIFDGANLVANFESLNLANTYWQKAYNVYANVDHEAARFLEFETWWGSPVLLNAEEMQWIADNLFVGNKLATGEIRSCDGVRVDLRNIRAPIIVFCSWGDDITPPQQALGWITDLYDHEQEIEANGQTIVYTLHQSIGHLGIFVSAKVARLEHRAILESIEEIAALAPGLYEMKIDNPSGDPDCHKPEYSVRFEERDVADIKVDTPLKAFERVRQISEANEQLYKTFVSPCVRSFSNPATAALLEWLHPMRTSRYLLSDEFNPWMRAVAGFARLVEGRRAPLPPGNAFLARERELNDQVFKGIEQGRKQRDALEERVFTSTYGGAEETKSDVGGTAA